MTDQPKNDPKTRARASFTGRGLTASQFDESWAITGILARDIQKTGSFRDTLTDYAHAFARSKKFDQMKGETILRDIFTARYDQSLNQMREGLMAREAALREVGSDQALHHAQSISEMIRNGATMPFYQAYDQAAVTMARQHGITEAGAKTLMKEAYGKAEGQDLYTIGKALEAKHHTPVREADITARKAERDMQARPGPVM